MNGLPAGARVELYDFEARPSRKALTDLSKKGATLHAALQKVVEASPTLDEAQAMARGLLQNRMSLRAELNSYAVTKDLHDLVSLSWADGHSAPSGTDIENMLGFLAGEQIEDELMRQVERRYDDFAKRGVVTISEGDRRREIARASPESFTRWSFKRRDICSASSPRTTSCSHPRATMSAKALLGVL